MRWSLSVTIPQTISLKNASYEVRHKQSYDWPLVQAAVAYQVKDGKAKDVKIVLGHVAPTPLVATEAAKAVEGQAITEETAAQGRPTRRPGGQAAQPERLQGEAGRGRRQARPAHRRGGEEVLGGVITPV